MLLIAARFAEAGLIMSDDRVIPIAHIKRAIRPESHIDWPEAATGRLDERRQVRQAEACSVIVDPEAPDGVVDVAPDDERALPRFREMRSADDLPTADFPSVS